MGGSTICFGARWRKTAGRTENPWSSIPAATTLLRTIPTFRDSWRDHSSFLANPPCSYGARASFPVPCNGLISLAENASLRAKLFDKGKGRNAKQTFPARQGIIVSACLLFDAWVRAAVG